jgi:hypothetical protein
MPYLLALALLIAITARAKTARVIVSLREKLLARGEQKLYLRS